MMTFVVELGPPTYAMQGADGQELSDRWEEAIQIKDLVRALRKPFPGAFTYLEGKKLVVWEVDTPPNKRIFEGIVPGRVVGIHKGLGVEVFN